MKEYIYQINAELNRISKAAWVPAAVNQLSKGSSRKVTGWLGRTAASITVLQLLGVLPETAHALPDGIGTSVSSIVGGDVSDGDPSDKAIVYLSLENSACTGTFIHPNYILTAAHCLPLCDDVGMYGTGCLDADNKDDVAFNGPWQGVNGHGSVRWWASDGVRAGEGTEYSIDGVYFPQSWHFDNDESAWPPDVALLRTPDTFTGKLIRMMPPTELPHPSTHCDLHDDDVVEIAGYSDNKGTVDQDRQIGDAVVECDLEEGDRTFKVDSRGHLSRACPGDSGGPAMWLNFQGDREVGGVISFGDDVCPNVEHETGVAFVPKQFLDERARNDPRCHSKRVNIWGKSYWVRNWDTCSRQPELSPYVGCFRDASQRDMLFISRQPDMTTRTCMDQCRTQGFLFAGTQYGSQCFCGDSYGSLGKADNCNMPCSGDPGETCGGRWANSVYRLSDYEGCFRDASNRDLSYFAFSRGDMTTDMCIAECAQRGFAFAGTQYSSQCFCGDSYGVLGKADNCNMPCSGDPGETCGGRWANSVWHIGR